MSASAPTFDAHAQRSRLSAMPTGELRQLYRELSGDEARSRNREYLARRILWMLQAQALGGQTIRVTVLAGGFEFMGERFGSLSAIAKAVTGTHVSGFRFFGLAKGTA